MNAVWLTIILLAVGTFAIKAAGPLTLGEAELPEQLKKMISLVAPALLAALIVQETLTHGHRELRIDARVVGLLVAAIALFYRLPLIIVVVIAAGSTAAVRLLT